MFGWDFSLMLSRDSEDEMWSRFMFELLIWLQEATLARWTQSSGPLCLWQCLFISDGIAIVLTILTIFSTPILTKIFGDGSVEVVAYLVLEHDICFYQGEEPEDFWANFETAEGEDQSQHMVNCLFSYCHTLKMILYVQDNFQGVTGSEANGIIQVRESTSTKRPLPQIFIHVREACLHQYCFCSSVQKGRGYR